MTHPEHNGLPGQCEWMRKGKKRKKKKLTNILADNGHKAQADLEELSVNVKQKKKTLTNKQNRIMRIGNNWKEQK